jgi:hypothetical protein
MSIKSGLKKNYFDKLEGVAYKFAGLNNVIDPFNLQIEKGWLPKAQNVDIDNTDSIQLRQGRALLVSTTTAHSGWGNNKNSYYVDGNYLKEFDGTTATTIDVVTSNKQMYYVQANDVVVYSNGIESGIRGGFFTQGKLYSEYFKESTTFGILLEFYNGRVYHVKDCSLYCTDMFDLEHTDVRHKHVMTVRSAITMVKRVEDGLVVGSKDQIHFLSGNDIIEGGFELNIIADYGVIIGTDVHDTGDRFPEAKSRGEIVVFTTQRGICTCGSGGNFINHSYNFLSIPESSSGCSIIRDNAGFRQYIVTLNGDSADLYNAYVHDGIYSANLEVNNATSS